MYFFGKKTIAGLAAVVFSFVFLSVALAITAEERRQLEQDLAKVEKEIVETEGIIIDYQQQAKTLKGEIGRYDSEIKSTNLKIRALDLSINKLDGDIDDNKTRVAVAEEKLEDNKNALREALQSIYEKETETIIEILLQSPTLSNFFAGVNDLLEVQEDLGAKVQEILNLRDQLLEDRENLANNRADQASLRGYRDSEKKNLQSKKSEKNELLGVTKGVEAKYQEVLKVKQQTAAQIRSRIFEFLGGGQLTFDQAYQLAKSASDLTGVRPAMILAVLDKESALGRNVGRCSYQEAMHPTRDIPKFLEITAKLAIDPNSVLVSCPISYDGAYGGAMGPAQFIPSTWVLYEERISSLTGKSPANPWSNLDAFVATALYLKEARSSQACVDYGVEYQHILPQNILQDRCAAAKYYAGSRWWNYRLTYGERVITKATQFEEDIARITS